MERLGKILPVCLFFVQACGLFGQNAATDSSGGSGPLASFNVIQVSSTKIVLDATQSVSFQGQLNGRPVGYLEYRWSFKDVDGDELTQKIGFAPKGTVANGNQTLGLSNGGNLEIKENQEALSVQYEGVSENDSISTEVCLEVRDAADNLNTLPTTGPICQEISIASFQMPEPEPETPTYTIGGSVSGLTGTLILENNGGDDLALTADGAFTFATEIEEGSDYDVTVSQNPLGQTCVVTNGSGTATTTVNDIDVICSTESFTVGGTVTGLNGTIVLQNNLSADLIVVADGAFMFGTTLDFGDSYDVTVLSEPATQNCSVTNPTGVISGNVIDIVVTCTNDFYTVGGTVSGLTGTLILENNGGDDETINANGSFTFNTSVQAGDSYLVTVNTQPSGQTCVITNETGVISANVTNVTVVCSTNSYTVGGTVTGLNGNLTLQNNGGDDLLVVADGAFNFPTSLLFGDSFNVTVLSEPATQDCSVTNALGTVSTNVITITVTCVNASFSVGGTVSGLTGTLILENNGGDDETINANGAFTFNTSIQAGNTYTVSVDEQPIGQTCSLTNESGTVSGNVTNITISCSDNIYTIGGTVTGLSGTLVLQNNGSDDETILGDGNFVFDTMVPENGSYAVTIFTQPGGQLCSVSNGSGTATGNISNVAITCQASYSLEGSFTGIPDGVSVTLIENESGDLVTVNGNVGSTGTFAFSNAFATTDPYEVYVDSQDTSLACTLYNKVGTFTGSDVTNVTLHCSTKLACTKVESKYLKHCNPTANDNLGFTNTVSVSNHFAAAGVYLDDANSDATPSNNGLADSGAVFVFQRDDLSGDWVAVDFLKATNLEAADWFGYAVDLDGINQRLIVGARQEDSNSAAAPSNNALSAAGAAYIFERGVTGNWSQVAYLKHPNPTATDNCGTAVAIDGDYAVMGCPDEDSNSAAAPSNNSASASGCAIVYNRSGGGVWNQLNFLKASNLSNSDQFGIDVKISGEYLIVGSIGEDSSTDVLPGNGSSSNSGAAYIFRFNGSAWTQEDFLKPTVIGGSDNFGYAVDVTEEGYAIVGARNEDSNSSANPADNSVSASGAAYIFERNGSANWVQSAFLKHPSPTANDLFGFSVGISGDRAIVGVQSEDSDGPYAVNEGSSASGAAYVYERDGGGAWNQYQFLKPFNQDASDLFGTAVSIHEDEILVGAYGEDSVGTSPFNEAASASGAGYVYEFDGVDWIGD